VRAGILQHALEKIVGALQKRGQFLDSLIAAIGRRKGPSRIPAVAAHNLVELALMRPNASIVDRIGRIAQSDDFGEHGERCHINLR
jgi:hypothetical protein